MIAWSRWQAYIREFDSEEITLHWVSDVLLIQLETDSIIYGANCVSDFQSAITT